MYPSSLFLLLDFCRMLLVFNVNSGQECQTTCRVNIYVNNRPSAIVRYRPRGRSHDPDVLSSTLPIRCQHYLVCLVLHKCTLLISGSRRVWTEANRVGFLPFSLPFLLLRCVFIFSDYSRQTFLTLPHFKPDVDTGFLH